MVPGGNKRQKPEAMADICAAKFKESFHGFAAAHSDHAPWRSGVSAERRNSWEEQSAALCRDASTKRRFMRSEHLQNLDVNRSHEPVGIPLNRPPGTFSQDRKSTRLNSSHLVISYAVFCLKKKKNQIHRPTPETT